MPVAIEIRESPVVIVVAEAANEVPDTVTFPEKVTLPDIVCPLNASDLSSATDTAFAAICVAVTAFPASSTAETEFTASFAFVTWSSAICIVSIEPDTSSAVSTVLAAKCLAKI